MGGRDNPMSCGCGKTPCVYQAEVDAVIRAEQGLAARELGKPADWVPPPKRDIVPFYCRKKHGKTRGAVQLRRNQPRRRGDFYQTVCLACRAESQRRYKARRATITGTPKQEVAAGN